MLLIEKEEIIKDLKQKVRDNGYEEYSQFLINFIEPVLEKHIGKKK